MKQTIRIIAPAILAGPSRPDLLRDDRLHDFAAVHARQAPRAVALRCDGNALTYQQLDERAEQLCAGLRAHGIRTGDIVGIWLDRSITLHVAVLATSKAGATFLPFDMHAPAARVALCLLDCAATLLITDRPAGNWPCPAIHPDRIDSVPASCPAPRPPATQAAYIIYTSGSTGRPKGVAVSHRSICHLIRAENEVLRIDSQDIVYQGFSTAFDMALEEVFIAYLVGATLIVATHDEILQTDRLPAFLTVAGVSVLHCVPTMLAMLDGDLPSVRLINVGGEACPEALVDRWARPGRRLVNTYGPTETTVTATAAELRSGEPVTIGTLLPNYTAILLDDSGRPITQGGPGELCIGGPGVCLGYLNRPELNAQSFISLPTEQSLVDPVLYRTGDIASVDPDGRLVLHGRRDDQVKIRGYRVDLGEIEAELCRLPGIRAAACLLSHHGPTEHLTAFVVHGDGYGCDDLGPLRAALGKVLPCYMVPAVIRAIPAMPRLPSGKIDRKSLPPLSLPPCPPPADAGSPEQADLLLALRALFPHAPVEPDADFFRDLGGHSLLAAILVSQLRKQPRFSRLSLIDLYNRPTAAALALQFPSNCAAAAQPEPTHRPSGSRLRHALCATGQAATLPFLLALAAFELLAPFLAFDWFEDRSSLVYGVLAALAVAVTIPPGLIVIAIVAKWTLLGRVREGRYPLWGSMYFRWWLVSRLTDLVNTTVLADTPLLVLFHRAMGARIGPRVHLGSLTTGVDDLIAIGAGTTLGSGVTIGNAVVDGGWLTLGRVTIGAGAQVGSGCVLGPGTTIGSGGELGNLSMLLPGDQVPADQVWAGSPATFCNSALPRPGPAYVSGIRFLTTTGAFASVAGLLLPVLYLIPMVPSLFALQQAQLAGYGRAYLLNFAPLIAFAYVLLVLAEIIGLRWLILGRVQEGVHGTHSLFFLRKWTVDRLLDMSLAVLHPFFASLYVRPLFRALGAKIGRGAEISTAASVTHDLLEIGEGAFVADAVTLGDPEIRDGRLTLRRTVLGNRAFIGNCALLPDGVHIADNCLVGCLSLPPIDTPLTPGQACFGSPSVLLPARQASTAWDVRLTFEPGPRQVAARLLIEGARILLPRAAIFIALCVSLDLFEALALRVGDGPALLAMPFVYGGVFCIPALLGTVTLKWALIGRYRAAEYPMWSRPVWLTEAVTAIYEGLPVPLFLRHLRGTPFLPAALRLFGARIGRRVWLDSTDLTEFDLVTIGDDAELARDSGPQTHLFEDRVMKVGPVTLGARSSVGIASIILPGGRLDQDAQLGALSLVMKGETIPAGSCWAGSPSRARDAPAC